jgi:hypothetical protein
MNGRKDEGSGAQGCAAGSMTFTGEDMPQYLLVVVCHFRLADATLIGTRDNCLEPVINAASSLVEAASSLISQRNHK